MKKTKLKLLFPMFLMMVFITTSLAFADDDDDEEDDDDDHRSSVTVSAPEPVETKVSTPKPKTYKQTIIVTPAQIVTENQIQTTTVPDSDNDGIADSEDPHPSIPEIFVVQDANENGIVDTFEYGV